VFVLGVVKYLIARSLKKRAKSPKAIKKQNQRKKILPKYDTVLDKKNGLLARLMALKDKIKKTAILKIKLLNIDRINSLKNKVKNNEIADRKRRTITEILRGRINRILSLAGTVATGVPLAILASNFFAKKDKLEKLSNLLHEKNSALKGMAAQMANFLNGKGGIKRRSIRLNNVSTIIGQKQAELSSKNRNKKILLDLFNKSDIKWGKENIGKETLREILEKRLREINNINIPGNSSNSKDSSKDSASKNFSFMDDLSSKSNSAKEKETNNTKSNDERNRHHYQRQTGATFTEKIIQEHATANSMVNRVGDKNGGLSKSELEMIATKFKEVYELSHEFKNDIKDNVLHIKGRDFKLPISSDNNIFTKIGAKISNALMDKDSKYGFTKYREKKENLMFLSAFAKENNMTLNGILKIIKLEQNLSKKEYASMKNDIKHFNEDSYRKHEQKELLRQQERPML
jgi:hypothetical protein